MKQTSLFSFTNLRVRFNLTFTPIHPPGCHTVLGRTMCSQFCKPFGKCFQHQVVSSNRFRPVTTTHDHCCTPTEQTMGTLECNQFPHLRQMGHVLSECRTVYENPSRQYGVCAPRSRFANSGARDDPEFVHCYLWQTDRKISWTWLRLVCWKPKTAWFFLTDEDSQFSPDRKWVLFESLGHVTGTGAS